MRDIFYIKFKKNSNMYNDVGKKYNFDTGKIKNIIEEEYYISNYLSNNIIKSLFELYKKNYSKGTYILCPKYRNNNDIQIGVTGKCLRNENRYEGLEREISEEIGFYIKNKNNVKHKNNNFIINFDKNKEESKQKINFKINNFKVGEDNINCKISSIIYSNNLESLIKYYKNNYKRSGNNGDGINEVCFVNLHYIINTIKTLVSKNKDYIDTIKSFKNVMINSYNILQTRKHMHDYIKNIPKYYTDKLQLVLYTNDTEEYENMKKLGNEMSNKIIN